MAATTRNCCILFADVAGSTRLYEQLGDAEALRAIERCLNRVERAIVACGGKVIKTIGDELMATFSNAEMACRAAEVMQARIDGLPAVGGDKLAIRVGFHYGQVLMDGNDVFGNTVNVASRIAEVSRARQIITSAETAALLPASVRNAAITDIEPIKVKGLSTAIEIVEIQWKVGAAARLTQNAVRNSATPPAAAKPSRVGNLRVILRYGKQEILLRGNSATVTMGRDQTNDIVIHDPRASRQHGIIELRNGQCVIQDKSSNGTFVTTKANGNIALHKEEALLEGSGRICFGHICAPDSTGSLTFEVNTEKN